MDLPGLRRALLRAPILPALARVHDLPVRQMLAQGPAKEGMTRVRFSPSGPPVDLATGEETTGLQTAWAIDPLVGNDNAVGTPDDPLATAEEFSLRLQGVTVRVAATLQCVGNVVDSALTFNGTRFAAGASLTVSGTLTTLGTGQVSSTSAIGPGWQVTTTGIDWTTIPVTSHIGLSTGQAAAISEVVDANNVIIGMIAAPGTSATSVAPTNGSTITASSRSQIWPLIVNAVGQSALTANQIIVQNASFVAAGSSNGFVLQGGVGVQLYACEINNHNSLRLGTSFNARVCKFTLTATMAWQGGANIPTSLGCVVGGTGSTVFSANAGLVSHQNLLMTGARLTVNSGFLIVSIAHIRNTAGPVLVSGNGQLNATGIISGSVGNTGIGIDVPNGRYAYVGAGSKPTVAGVSDTRVGGVTRTYAQIPFVALQLDATPPTVTTLTGNGAALVQE